MSLRHIVNPAVLREAELVFDGPFTDDDLWDLSARMGFPLNVPATPPPDPLAMSKTADDWRAELKAIYAQHYGLNRIQHHTRIQELFAEGARVNRLLEARERADAQAALDARRAA